MSKQDTFAALQSIAPHSWNLADLAALGRGCTIADLEWLIELAESTEWPEGDRGMSATLRKYRESYDKTQSASGNSSADNGDDLATALRGLQPEDVALLAEQVLGLEAGFLLALYGSLNPGQVRMNSGNRIRAAIKRGDLEETQVIAAIH